MREMKMMKSMRTGFKIIVITLLCLALTACSGNGDSGQDSQTEGTVEKIKKKIGPSVTTEEFMEDFVSALESRWDINDSFQDAPELERYDNYNQCVQAELDVLEAYRDRKFKDEELGEIAQKYLKALDKQKEAYDYKDDAVKYHETWGQGYDARVVYLRQINEKYGLVNRFSDYKYVKGFESMTGVYTQIPVDHITETDWVGIWGTVLGDTAFGFHIDSIDVETKTCEVYVYATREYYIDSAPVEGTMLDNERLYFEFEDSTHAGDDAYTVKFIIEKMEGDPDSAVLTIDWGQVGETTDENVYDFVTTMNANDLHSITIGREY